MVILCKVARGSTKALRPRILRPQGRHLQIEGAPLPGLAGSAVAVQGVAVAGAAVQGQLLEVPREW